jgi:hypothetical protein
VKTFFAIKLHCCEPDCFSVIDEGWDEVGSIARGPSRLMRPSRSITTQPGVGLDNHNRPKNNLIMKCGIPRVIHITIAQEKLYMKEFVGAWSACINRNTNYGYRQEKYFPTQ